VFVGFILNAGKAAQQKDETRHLYEYCGSSLLFLIKHQTANHFYNGGLIHDGTEPI
jgi:hypothetical protein